MRKHYVDIFKILNKKTDVNTLILISFDIDKNSKHHNLHRVIISFNS